MFNGQYALKHNQTKSNKKQLSFIKFVELCFIYLPITHKYIYIYIYICVCLCVYVCVCAFVCVCICVCKCVCEVFANLAYIVFV